MHQHKPEQFDEYQVVKNMYGEIIGFDSGVNTYYFDATGGWCDFNGCYYNSKGQPDGWYIIENHTVKIYDQNQTLLLQKSLDMFVWLKKQKYSQTSQKDIKSINKIQKNHTSKLSKIDMILDFLDIKNIGIAINK